MNKIILQYLATLLRREKKTIAEIVRFYGEMWKRLKAELDAMDKEYRESGTLPYWKYNRAKALKRQVEQELAKFSQFAEEKLRQEQQEAIEAAERYVFSFFREDVRFNRFDRNALYAMLGTFQPDSPLKRLFSSLSTNGAAEAEKILLEGMLLGKNPNAIAPMLRKALGIPLYRAIRIARTETMRAHREAMFFSYQANSDIITGWIWYAALDRRTCPACWAMHGTKHKLTEKIHDHPNGRCISVPIIADAPMEIPTGQEEFDKLPEDIQKEILENRKGKLADMVTIRETEWGKSIALKNQKKS